MDLNRLSRDTGYYLAITSFNLVTTAAMTFALVWVFSLYGIILFCALSPEDPTYFGSMYNAMWSMFICITSTSSSYFDNLDLLSIYVWPCGMSPSSAVSWPIM